MANCCANTCGKSVAAAASKKETSHRKHRRGTLKLLGRATTVGKNIGELCRSLYEREGQVAVRRILGLLSFFKKYGAASCDEACELAMETGGGYHFVRKYLERRPATLGLLQIDPIIRQLTIYRDLIEQRGNVPSIDITSTQENAPL